MQYPLISQYVEAIREAGDNLSQLAHLEPVLDDYDEPFRSSGAFAVVFKMKDSQTGKCYALKCFTEDQEGREEAYRKIADELESVVTSSYITPVRYLERELFVDCGCSEQEFPVLQMDWIEGDTLGAYVSSHYQDQHAMGILSYRFCQLASWLRSQPFAHGDLKPDNIMVREDGTLALVDYDGMYVPAMKGEKSPTIGTRDFSHPQRTADDFDETIDDFALSSIALSLKAISLSPSLYDDYASSDRLLFSADDYCDLSKSQVLTALQPFLADSDLNYLLSLFFLSRAKKNLSLCPDCLFLGKNQEGKDGLSTMPINGMTGQMIPVFSTKVTEEDLVEAVEDEFGAKYSRDGKRLLKGANIPSYVIKEGTMLICDLAFENCSSLASISMPSCVTSIGDGAFRGCSGLLSISVPSCVTSIGDGAFENCSALLSVSVPSCVTSIGNGVFKACSGLTSISIPSIVTTIGDDAFNGCSRLASFFIPSSVTSIGSGAFSGCSSLSFISIPSCVNTMTGNPFAGWHGQLEMNSPNFAYKDGVLIDKKKGVFVGLFLDVLNFSIPSGVTSIGDGAFSCCESLISISIPSSVTSIGNKAFRNCYSLTSISIPSSVTSMGDGVFSGCSHLTSIEIPSTVTKLGNSVFRGCSGLVVA